MIIVLNEDNDEITQIISKNTCIIGKTGIEKSIFLRNLIELNNFDTVDTLIITPHYNNYKNMRRIYFDFLSFDKYVEERDKILNNLLVEDVLKKFNNIIFEEFGFLNYNEAIILKNKILNKNKNIIITLQENDFFEKVFIDDNDKFYKIILD